MAMSSLMRLFVLSVVLGCQNEENGVLICDDSDVADLRYISLDDVQEIR